MQETKKDKSEIEEELAESEPEDAWAEDQAKHEYYYDDAHGYQTYDPEEIED